MVCCSTMSESERRTYILRGWLAFAAFVDFAIALRSYVDLTTFFGTELRDSNVPLTTARAVSCLHIHTGLTMAACAFAIHSFPLTIMTALSIVLKTLYWLSEAIVWRTTSFSFHILFPAIVNGISLYGIFIIQPHLRIQVKGEELLENALKKKMSPEIFSDIKKVSKIKDKNI
ncbi:uncharacterized protein LOC136041972 isoform X1 [Artemia franciscana]|uniref:uncharacterized protein LOC136041972 isoform X1 n=1 Tax=Artemia franciscana TaxID=6661 RepID=UPI0032DB55F0